MEKKTTIKRMFLFLISPIKIGISLCSTYFLFLTSFSQDIHFSQFYNIPLVVNPAMTGAFNGDQRVALNYKDQWKNVGSPYRTYALSFDMGFMKKKWEKSYLGGGLLVYKDVAGSAKMGTTQASLSISSFVSLGENQKISAGLQGGFVQRSLTVENQSWDNQFCLSCPDGYDPAASPNETTSSFSNVGFGDFTGGLQWTYSMGDATISSNDKKSINAGIAFHHVNRPTQKFYDAASIDKMYSRISAHGGAFIGIKNFHIAVIPSILYSKQGPAQEINFGTMIRYTIKEESRFTGVFKETAVSLGGYARAKDAFIPALQIEYASYAMGITYDVNTSTLRNATKGNGGFEISLRYINPNPFKGSRGSVRFL